MKFAEKDAFDHLCVMSEILASTDIHITNVIFPFISYCILLIVEVNYINIKYNTETYLYYCHLKVRNTS